MGWNAACIMRLAFAFLFLKLLVTCIFTAPSLDLLRLGAVLFQKRLLLGIYFTWNLLWFNDSLYHKTEVNACVECSRLGISFCPFEHSHTLSLGEIPSWCYLKG